MVFISQWEISISNGSRSRSTVRLMWVINRQCSPVKCAETETWRQTRSKLCSHSVLALLPSSPASCSMPLGSVTAYVQISVPPKMPCLVSTLPCQSVSLRQLPAAGHFSCLCHSPVSLFQSLRTKARHERVQRALSACLQSVLSTAISRWMENWVSVGANVRSLFTLKSRSHRGPGAGMCYQYSHSLRDTQLLTTAQMAHKLMQELAFKR